MKELTYDEFIVKFKPIKNHLSDAAFDGYMFGVYGEEKEWVSNQNITQIWTIVEAEGEFYILSGYHLVNRFGYIVTEIARDINDDYKVLIKNK